MIGTTEAPDRRALRLPLLLAVVAVVLGALGTSAIAAYAVGDPGAVVRWGLPLATVVRNVAMSVVVGLLLLSVFVVPERRDTHRRDLAARLATRLALVWFTAAVLVLVFTFADLSGTAPGTPGFLAQLRAFVTTLEITRVLLLNVAAAALVAVGAALARRRGPTAWVLAAAVVGLVVLALTGHGAASTDHETSVNALAVHLLAAGCWVGGLVGLGLLRPTLGGDLGVAVRRFSTIASWCLVAVALSGFQQAWLRVGSWSGLGTAYGVLVLVKVAALLGLGAFGLRQRRLLAERLDLDPSDRGAFARLALGEIAIMGIAFGVGTALARSAPPRAEESRAASRALELTGYPDPGPMRSVDWLVAWRPDWLLLALAVVMIGLYAAAVLRLRARGDAWPLGRLVLWTLGWLAFIWATSGGPDIWGRVLFSVHMVMHMVVAMMVPLLLVPAAPITLLLRAIPARTDKTWGPRELVLQVVHSRALRLLANPVVAASLFFVSLATFYYSPAFELALRTHTGHLIMLAHFLLTGYLFTWVLIGIDPGPPKWSPPLLLLVLFATVSFHAFFGVILTGNEQLLAPNFYQNLQLPWMTDPFADQKTAGEIAWGVGELPTLILALLVAREWLRADRVEQRRVDRQADRDGDAELAAYNAMLKARREHLEGRGGSTGEGNQS